jgi:hypothetical protein
MMAARLSGTDLASGTPFLSEVSSTAHLLNSARMVAGAVRRTINIDRALKVDESLTAAAAVRWIFEELFADFPFEEETDRAAALALLLCFMQRPLLKTCPAFAAVAPQPGTGKRCTSRSVRGSTSIAHRLTGMPSRVKRAGCLNITVQPVHS